jgi:hypothetical protein
LREEVITMGDETKCPCKVKLNPNNPVAEVGIAGPNGAKFKANFEQAPKCGQDDGCALAKVVYKWTLKVVDGGPVELDPPDPKGEEATVKFQRPCTFQLGLEVAVKCHRAIDQSGKDFRNSHCKDSSQPDVYEVEFFA